MFKVVLFNKLKTKMLKQTDIKKHDFIRYKVFICIALHAKWKQNKLSGYFKKNTQITFMMKLIKIH